MVIKPPAAVLCVQAQLAAAQAAAELSARPTSNRSAALFALFDSTTVTQAAAASAASTNAATATAAAVRPSHSYMVSPDKAVLGAAETVSEVPCSLLQVGLPDAMPSVLPGTLTGVLPGVVPGLAEQEGCTAWEARLHAPIWALPARPLFFAAPRAEAKAFASALMAVLTTSALAEHNS